MSVLAGGLWLGVVLMISIAVLARRPAPLPPALDPARSPDVSQIPEADSLAAVTGLGHLYQRSNAFSACARDLQAGARYRRGLMSADPSTAAASATAQNTQGHDDASELLHAVPEPRSAAQLLSYAQALQHLENAE